jgi:DNA (cytosine-5)-methyltransferase 1
VSNVATRPLNILSLCSGGGGLDRGISLALPSSRTVCWVEWEAFAAEFLASSMDQGSLHPAPVWSDLRTFDGRPWRGLVDGITAGYPCQPFSLTGKLLGEDDPRHLWPHVARVIKEAQPSFVFCENVAGHLSLGAEEVFYDLQRMGYSVAAGLFSATEVGATTDRERLFILALADCKGSQRYVPSKAASSLVDLKALCKSRPEAIRESRRRSRDLPLWPPGPEEHDAWRSILARNAGLIPAIEPEVCGMADGLARYLKLLGNGVIPSCAAYAFASLVAALED